MVKTRKASQFCAVALSAACVATFSQVNAEETVPEGRRHFMWKGTTTSLVDPANWMTDKIWNDALEVPNPWDLKWESYPDGKIYENLLPTTGDSVEATSMREAVLGEGEAFHVRNMSIDADGAVAKLTIDGGTFTADGEVVAGQLNRTSEVTLKDGSFIAGNLVLGHWGNAAWGDPAHGILKVEGGTVTTTGADWTGSLTLGRQDVGAKGEVLVSGGTVNVDGGRLSVGFSELTEKIRAASSRVAVSGGIVRVRGELDVGSADKSGGFLEVSGGEVSVGSSLRVGQGVGSVGFVELTGGTVTSGAELRVGAGEGAKAEVLIAGGALVNNSGRISFGHGNDAQTYVEINGGAVSNLVEHIYIGGGIPAAEWNEYVETGNADTYTKFVMNDGTVYAKQIIFAGAWTSADTVINGGLLEADEAIFIGEYDMVADRRTTLTVNGGTLFAPRVVKTYSGKKPTTVLNINGGTFKAKTDTENYFENCGDLVITGDGLGFDTDGHAVVTHNHDGATYSGNGGITKKGQGTLTLRGTYALTGKIKVEAGTLVLPENQTIYCEGTEVADGATLELNGSTIIPVTKKIVSSVWTNASGDGNAANAANWRSHIKYFLEDGSEKEDLSAELDGVMPAADSDVTIPASSAVRPDMSGLTVRSVTLVATSDVSLRGDCTVPEIVKSAKAWYDFDDSASVTMEGGIPVGVANKGTAKDALDLVLFYPEESRRKPAYGLSSHYGRDVMSFTNSYGFVSKNAAGIVGDADRTLVAVSLRIRNTYPAFNGDGTPKEGEYEQQMFPLGIEKVGGNWQSGEFRLGQWAGSSNLDYDDSTVKRADWTTQALQGLRNIDPDEYAIWAMSSAEKTVSGSVMTESSGVENATSVTVGSNGTSEEAKLFVGMRQLYDSPSAGEVAEAMMFDKALSDEELAAVREYLHTKWFTPFDGTTVPSNIALENRARIDLGGGSWAFDKIMGAGTIANGDVTITEKVGAGLVVGGSLTLAEGATMDLSALLAQPLNTEVTLLTAAEIVRAPTFVGGENANRKVRILPMTDDAGRIVAYRGTVVSKGFCVLIR